MAFFEDLTKKTKDLAYVAADKAKDVAAVAADKAKDAAELTRISMAIVGGGALAIISGIVVVVIPLLLVPVLQKLGKPSDPLPPIEQG